VGPPRRRLVGCVLAALLFLLVPQSAFADEAVMKVDPVMGSAETVIEAQFTALRDGGCVVAAVQFVWNEEIQLESRDLDPAADCTAVLSFTPPTDTPGVYVVCGAYFDDHAGAEVRACAAFTLSPVPPTRSPEPTRSPVPPTRSPEPTRSPVPTPTVVPTGSASPSPSATPASLPTDAPLVTPGAPPIAATSGGSSAALLMPTSDDGELPAAVAVGLVLGLAIAIILALYVTPFVWPARILLMTLTFAIVASVAIVASPAMPSLLPEPVRITVVNYRVTQGLELDVANAAGVAYDLIAGKDTLVRMRISTTGLGNKPLSGTCSMSRGLVAGVAIPATVTVLAQSSTSTGETTSEQQVDCWIPGRWIFPSGYWTARVQLGGPGLTVRRYDLGAREFQATADLRLLIYPVVYPIGSAGQNESFFWSKCKSIPDAQKGTACPAKDKAGDTIRHTWDAAIFATAVNTLYELQRMWPLRAGIGPVDATGTGARGPDAPGLRYLFGVVDDSCSPPTPNALGLRAASCDRWAEAQLMLAEQNAYYATLEFADKRPRDRIDMPIILKATNFPTTGGLCQRSSRTPGGDIDVDPDGPSTFVMAQEIAHCLGLGIVDSKSPHSRKSDPRHSDNQYIALLPGTPLINTRQRTDVSQPLSGLHPKFESWFRASSTYLEGWEFNDIHDILLGLPRLDIGPSTYRAETAALPGPASSTRMAQTGPLAHQTVEAAFTPTNEWLVIAGTREESGAVDLTYSGVSTLPLNPTQADPSGTYALVERGARGQELLRLPFSILDAPDTHLRPGGDGFLLIAPYAPGTTAFELQGNETVLLRLDAVGAAPEVSAVRAVVSNDGTTIEASWDAAPLDGNLRYNVYFSGSATEPLRPMAIGLDGTRHVFQTRSLPTSDSARLIVRASDGIRTAERSSAPLQIPDRPPMVDIRAPDSRDERPAADRATILEAVAFDDTAGILVGDAVKWRSDVDGDLGSGDVLEVTLTPGRHLITVAVTSPSGLTANDSVTVDVRSTTPFVADASGPSAKLTVNPTSIDLGPCPTLATGSLEIRKADSTDVYTVSDDSEWLTVDANPTGTVRVTADCSVLEPHTAYAGRVLVAGPDNELHIIGVRVGDAAGRRSLDTWLTVVVMAAIAAIAGMAVVVFVHRRVRRSS
jgi:hypothetical protein